MFFVWFPGGLVTAPFGRLFHKFLMVGFWTFPPEHFYFLTLNLRCCHGKGKHTRATFWICCFIKCLFLAINEMHVGSLIMYLFFYKKKFYQKSRHEKKMCTSPFSKNTTQKERESIKSTKDTEGVPTRAHIQSNNDHKTCSLIRQAVRFHQRPVYFFHTADSIWRTKARLAKPWLLCGAETDIAKIQTVQHSFGHHPRQSEDKGPFICCHWAMKKQVINEFPTTLTHTTPINYQNVSLAKIVNY